MLFKCSAYNSNKSVLFLYKYFNLSSKCILKRPACIAGVLQTSQGLCYGHECLEPAVIHTWD